MPLGRPAYDPDSCEIRLIKLWIDSGGSETITKKEAREKIGAPFDPICDKDELKPETGQGSEEVEPEEPEPEIETLTTKVLNEVFIANNCIECHNEKSNNPRGLRLLLDTEENIFSTLVKNPIFRRGIKSVQKPRVNRISPGNSKPKRSYLIASVAETEEFRDSGVEQQPSIIIGEEKKRILSNKQIRLLRLWIDTMDKDEPIDNQLTFEEAREEFINNNEEDYLDYEGYSDTDSIN